MTLILQITLSEGKYKRTSQYTFPFDLESKQAVCHGGKCQHFQSCSSVTWEDKSPEGQTHDAQPFSFRKPPSAKPKSNILAFRKALSVVMHFEIKTVLRYFLWTPDQYPCQDPDQQASQGFTLNQAILVFHAAIKSGRVTRCLSVQQDSEEKNP